MFRQFAARETASSEQSCRVSEPMLFVCIVALASGNDSGDDDDKKEDDDADNQAYTHLHVLPPHLLANPVGATTESLGRDGKVVGLVLESIETLATLGDLVDVIAHHTDGVVDLSLKSLRSRIATSTLLLRGLAAGDIRVVGGVLLRHDSGW
jgi:hypothetical protein